MTFIELFLLSVGLAMDAFAVSVCKGLAQSRITLKKAALVGLWFGGFQALMPVIGFLLGHQFERYITAIDHWIAFILLAIIGISMLKEALSRDEEDTPDASLSWKPMFLLAVATSIDALAVGITFSFLKVALLPAVTLIGVITFLLSCLGVKIGNAFGAACKSKAEITGGIILIGIGCKILLEHLGLLG
ncbi:MAG: manganese efflux pump [Lachnospiraceae bacterium]|nr:manganese efflux pump [Lachnospiraceae bacterium]